MSHFVADGTGVDLLELDFCERLGVRHAVALASGTAALEIALRSVGIGLGDEVILSTYDWGAAAGAVLRLGGIPVFSDIDPERYTLDPLSVAHHLGPRTGAVVVTHLFGHPADVNSIRRMADGLSVPVIEDCAQALGATIEGKPIGTSGAAGCFSLGRGKLLSGWEGGVLVTNDRRLYEEAFRWSQHPFRQLAVLGETGPLGDLGDNARIHPYAAALAHREWDSMQSRLRLRSLRCETLRHLMADLERIRPPFVASGTTHAWHRFCPTFVPHDVTSWSRELALDTLTVAGVPVGIDPIGTPLHLRPVFQERTYGRDGWPWRQAGSSRIYRPGDCPVAEERCARAGFVVGEDFAEEEGDVSEIVAAFLEWEA
jgi:dTDP-4-amino-4,6-dideoxygalactose transaminase